MHHDVSARDFSNKMTWGWADLHREEGPGGELKSRDIQKIIAGGREYCYFITLCELYGSEIDSNFPCFGVIDWSLLWFKIKSPEPNGMYKLSLATTM